jgi:Family of unknown function (DUF6476)
LRALKILVVVMGVMLIGGFAALVAVIAGRAARGPGATVAHTLADGRIDIPRGAHIEAMTVAADRLILALVLPEGRRQLVVIDLASGTLLGTIDLQPVP